VTTVTPPARRASGELEADVLTTLWRAEGPLTPGQVRDRLGTDLAYTTVMTILSRLYDKGSVTRTRAGRAYLYTPAFEQAEVAALQMREVLNNGHNPDDVLARFVSSLSSDEERTLTALLRHTTEPRS
jgi:predicted transcriptional regulator